jgi:hypothetical protein
MEVGPVVYAEANRTFDFNPGEVILSMTSRTSSAAPDPAFTIERACLALFFISLLFTTFFPEGTLPADIGPALGFIDVLLFTEALPALILSSFLIKKGNYGG